MGAPATSSFTACSSSCIPMGIGNPDLHSLDQVLPQWVQKCGKNMGFAPYLTIRFGPLTTRRRSQRVPMQSV
jgi:hypothetical protein